MLNNVEQASAADDNPAGCSASNPEGVACIKLSITPNTSDSTNGNVKVGEVAYFSSNIEVGGNHISNYALSLNTTNGSNGELVGENNPYATVGKIAAGTAATAFPDNTWGYAVSEANTTPDKTNLTYNPVPGTDTNNSVFLDFKKGLSGTISNTYKLVFAAKLGSSMPADHYKTDIYFSAIASATETAENWFRNTARINTMQEMNSKICENAPEHATSQLTDSRDGKFYWVTKLKDGNCWMTQNLAYNGGGVKQCELDGGTTCSGWSSGSDDAARYAIGTHTNEHSSQGNFYSWNAAVNEICPEGWQLPKTFGNLTYAYGINSNTGGSATIRANPLYFVSGGAIGNGQLNDAGGSGNYWSSTADPRNSTQAYRLFFNNSSVDPSYSNNYGRYAGMSVRYVAE